MKYLKMISENTIKNLIEENLNFKVEKLTKNENNCFIEIKSLDYSPNMKFQLNDYEANCLNENLCLGVAKKITLIFRNLFTSFFKDKYKIDLNNYLNTKENKFIKNLRNYQIEEIFKEFKVLSIKRLKNAIEIIATKDLDKEFLSCYITNFKIINLNPQLFKKEIKKIEKNYFSFMVSTYGRKYIEAFVLNENNSDEIKKC